MKAGRQCGDLVHPLVYCPELHFSEFTSAVADMKNSVAVGVKQGGPRSPCEAPDLGSEQGRGEIRGGDGPLTGLPAACPFSRHWGILPTLKSPIRSMTGFPFAPRVKADPLAQLPGPWGPSLLLSTLGPPPQAPSCRHRERWSLRMGVRRAQGVHRGHPRHGWGGRSQLPFYPRTGTTAPAPALASSSPHTLASTGLGSGSTWISPRLCTP